MPLDNEQMKKYMKKRRIFARDNAYESLYFKEILNQEIWNRWFNEKVSDKYKPCSISPNEAFNLMIQDCFYCGDLSTTLDRLDSTKEHTLENCVGCCEFCNRSKGACDPMSFVLRAVYRRTFEYYDNSYIWNDSKNKPQYKAYIKIVNKQNRPFDLTREQFNTLCISQCQYCQRKPKFVGIDKINPDNGYVVDNCVSCCQSCNRDKFDYSLEEFTLRDERITQRYLQGYFDKLSYVEKNTSHFKKYMKD
jgi:5-methylcytosine-specific restriction endonuclease McrA